MSLDACGSALLGVLDLFTDFFELGFGGDNVVGDLGAVALGSHGVELAEEFLEEEVEAASSRGGSIEIGAELLHVAGGAGELLRDVCAVGEKGDFFDKAFVIEWQGKSGVLQALTQNAALMLGDGGGFSADGVEKGLDGAETGLNIGTQAVTFGGAHGGELLQRGGEGFLDGWPGVLGRSLGLGDGKNAGDAGDISDGNLSRDFQPGGEILHGLEILGGEGVIHLNSFWGRVCGGFLTNGDVHSAARDGG